MCVPTRCRDCHDVDDLVCQRPALVELEASVFDRLSFGRSRGRSVDTGAATRPLCAMARTLLLREVSLS
jgi:hypothetical protein